jgi:hypothetical protein
MLMLSQDLTSSWSSLTVASVQVNENTEAAQQVYEHSFQSGGMLVQNMISSQQR